MAEAGADSIFTLLETPEPPELGAGPRRGVRTEAELRSEIDKLSGCVGKRDLLTALVFLWHDHLDAAHALAQDAPGSDGAFVHGIMHRREPDYGNAAYWFRRVGEHPVFPALTAQVNALPSSSELDTLRRKLVPNGKWNPFAFIDEVAAAHGREELINLLRQVQQLETEVLLKYFLK